ncbi:MAG: hypothetical protein ACE5NP_03625 [Anaerolineae bacterium]
MKRVALKESHAPYTLAIEEEVLSRETFILERDGEPVAAVIPIAEYEAFRAWREAGLREDEERKALEAFITRVFEGKDLLIPCKVIERLGVRPGEAVVIRPRVILRQRGFDAIEKAHRLEVLDALYGSWTAEDEAEFYRTRQEMWESWKPRSLS